MSIDCGVRDVSVAKLYSLYDPFKVLEITVKGYFDRDWPEQPHWDNDDTPNKIYDYGRISYMVRCYDPTPIEVETQWQHFSPYRLVLLDGHHRLCAAIIANRLSIPASVGGPVDMIEWITYNSDKPRPEWL